ncbi:porin [Paracidovorax oryzae]|uniref:porin n=1 Tax=Paracidovorax oryzae TaxID=862720 RepID=UPI0003199478|nr:porin [Paracidovorax oryzae]
MNKHSLPAALALAALQCASAHAQSAVTLYGTVDAAVTRRQLSGETAVGGVTSGGLSTSRWGIAGTEDLGGGLRAQFDLSSFIRVDTGDAGRSATEPYWARAAWVGLASATAGSVRLGRIPTTGFQQAVRFNPFGDSAVLSPFLLHNYLPSPSQSLMTSDGFLDSGWSNSVAYTSPSFADVTASVQYAAREGSGAGRRLGLGAIYGAPASKFSVGISYEKTGGAAATFPRRNPVSDPAAGVVTLRDFTNATVGASYDFGAVRLFGQYRHASLEGSSGKVRLETAQLGAAVPLGAGKVLASVARTEKTEAGAQDQNRTSFALGYDHDLSKRTDVYVATLFDKASGLDRGTTLAVGIRHRF